MIDVRALPAAQLVPLFAGTCRLVEHRTLGLTPASWIIAAASLSRGEETVGMTWRT